jgi:hypothetical protein
VQKASSPRGIPTEEFPGERFYVRNAARVRKWHEFLGVRPCAVCGARCTGQCGQPVSKGKGPQGPSIKSGSSTLGIKLSPGTKPLSNHRRRMEPRDAISCGRETALLRPPLPSAPTLFPRGKAARTAQPRPAPPTRSPARHPVRGATGFTKPLPELTGGAAIPRGQGASEAGYLRKRPGHRRRRRPAASPERHRRHRWRLLR